MTIKWDHKNSCTTHQDGHFDGRRVSSSHPWIQDLPGRLWPGARRQKALLFEFPARPLQNWLLI